MGTKVLCPHDCLVDRIKVPAIVFPCQRTNFYSHSRKPRSSRNKSTVKPNCAGKESLSRITKRSSSKEGKASPKNIVMGQFTLIRRGESLMALNGNIGENESVSSSEKINPNGIIRKNEIIIADSSLNHFYTTTMGIYAGSGFALSPSPESLPLPSFSKKMMTIDGSATRDLRRMLGLD